MKHYKFFLRYHCRFNCRFHCCFFSSQLMRLFLNLSENFWDSLRHILTLLFPGALMPSRQLLITVLPLIAYMGEMTVGTVAAHSRGGAVTTFVDAPSAVFNSDGFADAAAASCSPMQSGPPVKTALQCHLPSYRSSAIRLSPDVAFTMGKITHITSYFKFISSITVIVIPKTFFPDCAAYFSRIDDSGVVQTQTVYIDPTISPTFNPIIPTPGNGLRFYARFLYRRFLGEGVYGIQFRTNSINSVEYTHERFSANDWWRFSSAGTVGAFGYPYYLTTH